LSWTQPDPRELARLYADHPDILVCTLLALVLAVSALLRLPPVLDVPLSAAFALYLPAYLLLVALFPRLGDLLPVQRQALTVVSSVGLTPMVSYVLFRSAYGLTVPGWKLATAGLTLLLAGLALWRRSQIAPAQRYAPIWFYRLITTWAQPGRWRRPDPIGFGMIAALVLLALSIGYAAASVRWSKPTTEFYLADVRHVITDFNAPHASAPYSNSSTLNVDTTLAAELWVVNEEGRAMDYTVTQQVSGGAPEVLGRFVLRPGETRQIVTELRGVAPAQEKVVFQLFVNAPANRSLWALISWLLVARMAGPYRYLELWL
jgi:uncharacterized membrane protein